MLARKHTSEGFILVLKPRADVIRSLKQGYQWPHKNDMCPPIFFFFFFLGIKNNFNFQ